MNLRLSDFLPDSLVHVVQSLVKGHDGHADLLAKEANGELNESGLLLIHAEDQLMSAEGFQTIAEEFIALYKRLDKAE